MLKLKQFLIKTYLELYPYDGYYFTIDNLFILKSVYGQNIIPKSSIVVKNVKGYYKLNQIEIIYKPVLDILTLDEELIYEEFYLNTKDLKHINNRFCYIDLYNQEIDNNQDYQIKQLLQSQLKNLTDYKQYKVYYDFNQINNKFIYDYFKKFKYLRILLLKNDVRIIFITEEKVVFIPIFYFLY